MTEQEWLVCADPMPMRVFITPSATPRKLLLFACASCRRIAHLLTDARSLEVLAVVERDADGGASDEEVKQAHAQAEEAWREADAKCRGRRKRVEQAAVASLGLAARAVVDVANEARHSVRELKARYGLNRRLTSQGNVSEAARVAAEATPHKGSNSSSEGIAPAVAAEWAAQCHFLRDIFGNPFRSPTINLSCLTPDVITLAQAAYDERCPPDGTLNTAQLAILADALEDAGCSDTDILDHCRRPGEHVRGCWVVDLILGKG